MRPRWRGKDLLCLDQVANAVDSAAVLTPASPAPAAAVKIAWSPLLSGQTIPLIWERRRDAEPDDCFRR